MRSWFQWATGAGLLVCSQWAEAQAANPPPTPAPVPDSSGATPSEAPPANAECIPACRSGFLCHQGQCISRCNPACAPGERCLANGECEAPAPPAAPPSFTPVPSVPPSQVAATDLHAPSPAALNPILRAPGSFVFAARAGLQVVGGGHVEGECSAEGSFSCDSSSRNDTDESSPFMIGLDALIHAAPGLRLGAGYHWLPYAAFTADDENEDVHLGHEHALHAVIEGIIPVSPNIALALRARGGLHVLAVGGDLGDRSEKFLSDCRESILARCKIDRGPLLGKGYGAMFGVVGGASVRWRVDLAIERFSLSLPESKFELSDPDPLGTDGSVTRSNTLYGTRSWILGGVEL